MEGIVSPVEQDVKEDLDAVLGPIKEKRAALAAREEALKADLEAVRAGLRSYDRVLAVVEPKIAPAPKKRTQASRFSDESLNELFDKLKVEFGTGEFTVPQIVAKTGIDKGRVYTITRALRDTGRLLKTGVDKENRNASLYKLAEEE